MNIGNFKLIALLLISLCSFNARSQDIPDDYEFLASFDLPKDIKWAIPGGIILDSSKSYIAIEYDYKPTYYYIYRLSDKKLMKKISVKGYAYADNSYFHLASNSLYVDYGRRKSKYVRIDLTSFNVTKVSCDEAPYGCNYSNLGLLDTKYYGGKTIDISETGGYLMSHDDVIIRIYLKQDED